MAAAERRQPHQPRPAGATCAASTDDDEVDMAIVGCGAGGGVLAQRLARARLEVVALRRRAVLGSRPRLGQRRARLPPPVLDRTAGHRRDRPVPLGRTTPVGASAGRWSTSPATPPASTPRTSDTFTDDGVGADWPIGYDDLRPTTRRSKRSFPSPARLAVGRPAPLPASPHPSAATGTSSVRGAMPPGIEVRVGPGGHHQRPLRQPAPLHLPRILPPGLQGQRQGVTADHPRTRRPRPRRRDPGRLHGGADRLDDDGRATGVDLLPRRRRTPPAGPAGGGRRLLHRDAPAAAHLGVRALPGRLVQRLRPGRPLRDGAGRPADRGPLRRRDPHATRPRRPRSRPRRSTRPIPTKTYRRGFSIQCVSPLPITYAEHVVAQGHWGDVLREYMRDYVHWATFGALCEFLPRPTTASPWPTKTDRHGLPVAHFSYSHCDNDRALVRAARRMEEIHRPRARRRRSPSSATPIWSADAAWPPTSSRRGRRRPADLRRAQPLHHRRQRPADPGRANPALTIMALAARAPTTSRRGSPHRPRQDPSPVLAGRGQAHLARSLTGTASGPSQA